MPEGCVHCDCFVSCFVGFDISCVFIFCSGMITPVRTFYFILANGCNSLSVFFVLFVCFCYLVPLIVVRCNSAAPLIVTGGRAPSGSFVCLLPCHPRQF